VIFGKGKDKTKVPSEEEVETVIGPTTSFRGTIRCNSSIRIDGIFEGTIETSGRLIIGDQAKILADILAHNISTADSV
jgi:cytoskeletal protein CcmA (bactofilin family)